ncbi:MAG: GMC family oxidoreductase [Oscillochloris sp.]|nr:GMC family oxidoreductase [Oscillochloris sp.]
MIRDSEDLQESAELWAEVAIVGAGFAGLELATYLGRHGVNVVLLESGREQFDPQIQALAATKSVGKQLRTPDPDSPFTPYLPPIFRGEFRIRQFGGTSNIWTGKWRTFDELDFAERPWIPHSGWPISRAEIAPFYCQIAQDYKLGDFAAFAHSRPYRAAETALAPAGLKLSFHYWEQTASRPAGIHRQTLQQLPNVDLILGANATEIVLDPKLEQVESIVFQSLDGRRFSLSAATFVLAVGGLEGARLMLASNRQLPAGIGNQHGLVGRFHMDHPKSKRARLQPGPALAAIAEWTQTQPRPRFHVSLSLDDATQQARQILNHAIYLSPVYAYLVDYPQQQVERLKRALAQSQVGEMIAAAFDLLRSPRLIQKILQRRKYADRGGPIAYYQGSMYVEQAPNHESALHLSEERDALGLPKLLINWQLTDFDHTSFQTTLGCLVDAFQRAGLGKLDFGPEPLTLDDAMVDAAHHIGATRMAATPERGVVDANCKVFGVENLYIASSSVFPTGHSAAPTLTILALARRLGVHLLQVRSSVRQAEPSL